MLRRTHHFVLSEKKHGRFRGFVDIDPKKVGLMAAANSNHVPKCPSMFDQANRT